MKKITDIMKESKKPGLFLCGFWFLYLALGSEAFYILLVSTKEQLFNRLLATLATSESAALPAFFACGMFSKSLFIGKEPIEYYRRIIDRTAFWVIAGLVSIGSSIIMWGFQGVDLLASSELLPREIQILCGVIVGVYLVAGSRGFAKSAVSLQPQIQPPTPQPQIQPPVTVPTPGTPVRVVTATTSLSCCINNDPITPGQQVLECPFCKVKFHEQCARVRNIQHCPVCGKSLSLVPASVTQPPPVTQGIPLLRVLATANLQCCINNDPITPGQQVLECPFCKVKFHEQCARVRNIQHCPVCGNPVRIP